MVAEEEEDRREALLRRGGGGDGSFDNLSEGAGSISKSIDELY